MVTAQAGIPGDVEAGAAISGSPAFDHKTWLRASKVYERLPELKRSLKDLERRLTELENYSKEKS
jgi:UDP-3-O-[3-hydroxymyristoyl] glucosamine N-acyltransferase